MAKRKVKSSKGDANKKVVQMAFLGSTKNTHRFQEVDGNGVPVEDGFLIGSLYLRKDVIGETPPEGITVTVKVRAGGG